MPPADYLAASYYERWAFAVEAALVERGALTATRSTPGLRRTRRRSRSARRTAATTAFTAHLVRALQRDGPRLAGGASGPVRASAIG